MRGLETGTSQQFLHYPEVGSLATAHASIIGSPQQGQVSEDRFLVFFLAPDHSVQLVLVGALDISGQVTRHLNIDVKRNTEIAVRVDKAVVKEGRYSRSH